MAPRNQRSIESGALSGAKSQGREVESEKGVGVNLWGAEQSSSPEQAGRLILPAICVRARLKGPPPRGPSLLAGSTLCWEADQVTCPQPQPRKARWPLTPTIRNGEQKAQVRV